MIRNINAVGGQLDDLWRLVMRSSCEPVYLLHITQLDGAAGGSEFARTKSELWWKQAREQQHHDLLPQGGTAEEMIVIHGGQRSAFAFYHSIILNDLIFMHEIRNLCGGEV